MSSRVYESCVVNAKIGDVWEKVRNLDFSWLSTVDNVNNDGKDTVGSTVTVNYKDGTSQTLLRVELSDLRHLVTYEMIASNPPISYLSQVSTIRCRPITDDNSTFVEWVSDYSGDAGAEVIADGKFKKVDGLDNLKKSF